MRTVGFGILGCGGIGSWHAAQLQSLPGVGLIGMADADAAARERARARFAVPVHAELRDLLADPAIEVVAVCTPPRSHVPLACQVAEAGRHVLVEKPLALDAAEGRHLVEHCSRHRVKLGVVHQQRTQTACRAVKRLIEEGALGRLQHVVASIVWYRPAAAAADPSWRGQDIGGGLLLDAGVHLVDLLLWLFGPVVAVAARAEAGSAPGSPRTVTALLGFGSGVQAALAMSFAGNLYRDDVAIDVVGSRGGCRLEIRDHDHAEIVRLDMAEAEGVRARRIDPTRIRDLLRQAGGDWRDGPRNGALRMIAQSLPQRGRFPFRSPLSVLQRRLDRRAQKDWGQPQGHAAVLAQMADAVRDDGAPLVPGEEACAALAVIDAVLASIASGGRPVTPTPPSDPV